MKHHNIKRIPGFIRNPLRKFMESATERELCHSCLYPMRVSKDGEITIRSCAKCRVMFTSFTMPITTNIPMANQDES